MFILAADILDISHKHRYIITHSPKVVKMSYIYRERDLKEKVDCLNTFQELHLFCHH